MLIRIMRHMSQSAAAVVKSIPSFLHEAVQIELRYQLWSLVGKCTTKIPNSPRRSDEVKLNNKITHYFGILWCEASLIDMVGRVCSLSMFHMIYSL